MDGLNIRRAEVRIPPCHFERAMTENLLQMENRSTAPRNEDCKGVPESVQGAAWRVKPKLSAQPFDASQGAHS